MACPSCNFARPSGKAPRWRKRKRLSSTPRRWANSRVKDWPTLETAVDTKIEDQAEFVQWCKGRAVIVNLKSIRCVQRPESTLRKGTASADRGERGIDADSAETLSGIKHQQVSRWAKLLKDRDDYRNKLFGKAYAAAMACKTDTARRSRYQREQCRPSQNGIASS
jgi:hypothetical protein